MDSLKEFLKNKKKNVPFNFIYFSSELSHKKRSIKIAKFQTENFVPYPSFKPILFYLKDEQ